MAEIDTSIYKRPPPQDPLKTISDLGGAVDTLGTIATGEAVQKAMNPETGEIDRTALAGALRGTVAGATKAIPTLDSLEKLRQAGFQADQAGLETFQKRMAISHHLFGQIASDPNPSINKVYDVATQALDPGLNAKKYGITLPVIMNVLKQFRGPDGKPLSPQKIREKALELQTQSATTAEILDQHSPRHEVKDQGGQFIVAPMGTKARPNLGMAIPKDLPPTTTVATPQGSRYLGEQPAQPGGGIVLGNGQPLVSARDAIQPRAVPTERIGGPPPLSPRADVSAAPRAENKPQDQAPKGSRLPTGPAATLEPGYEDAAKIVAATGAQAASRLTEAADGAMSRKAMLGNLEDDLTKFTSGGGANWEGIARNWAGRNLPVSDSWKKEGAILDEKSLASQEMFAKQAYQIAQSQFATLGGTGTDAKLESAMSTSPSVMLSQLGNKGIIRLLKGNEDAILAKNKAWQEFKKTKGVNRYDEFASDFNQHFDPRVFQFKYIPKKERDDYVAKMDPADRQKFVENLTYAHKNKWVAFDK